MTMQRVGARDLVGQTGDVGSVVVAMTRLVMAVCEDGEMALRVGASEFWLGAGVMERLSSGIKLEVDFLLLDAAQAFCARVALATVVMS